MSRAKAVKLLKDVNKFSGKDIEDAEKFLEFLDENVLEGRMWDVKILSAVSNVQKGEARRWWRIIRNFVEVGRSLSFNFDVCMCVSIRRRTYEQTSIVTCKLKRRPLRHTL